MFRSTKSAESPSEGVSFAESKLRILAIVVLSLAAIAVLIAGQKPPGCDDRATTEALVALIAGRLDEQLGPNQAYELTLRPGAVTTLSRDNDGGCICRAEFEYSGPDGRGPLVMSYMTGKAESRRETAVQITNMDKGSVKR